MSKFQIIVDSIKEMVSVENQDKIQEVFDKEFSVLSRYFDEIYKDANDVQMFKMKYSFLSVILDSLINENREFKDKFTLSLDSYSVDYIPLKSNIEDPEHGSPNITPQDTMLNGIDVRII